MLILINSPFKSEILCHSTILKIRMSDCFQRHTTISYTPMYDLGVFKISCENFQWKCEAETQSSFMFCANHSIQANETILDEILFLKWTVKTKILYFIALVFES